MSQATNYLVLAVGTDIGKTFLVENWCCNFSQKKIPITAIKPVASGFKDDDNKSDSAKILAALNLELSSTNLEKISPWRFESITSPHFAAEIAGKKIDFIAVKSFCLEKISQNQESGATLLIEGAGGVMTPISNDKTFLDLAAELKIPVLLVTANYLGSISHTLCAVESLRAKNISVAAILVNELSVEKKSLLDTDKLISTLQNFTKIKVISMQNFLQKVA